MAIRRMISADPAEIRRFQADMIPLGRIRTGVYATPAGKRGRPEKLDRFRFTSPDRDLIEAVAAEYGGEARPWSPDKEPNRKEFEVITDTDELDVLIINGQSIDPTYEAWAAGRTCVRRCDGVWDVISQAACLCTGPDKPKDPQKLCKITTRVRVMLRRVVGVGSWMYESHGEYFATETGGLMAELVARATVAVPSVLRLELERRREPDREKGGFKTKEFYVARFRTTAATPQQALTGGDTLAQALTGAPVREIEARPVSAPVTATPAPPSVVIDVEGVRPLVLADIELQESVEGLEAIRDKLKVKGINDQRIIDAWVSKTNAVMAAAGLAEVRRMNAAAVASGLREEAEAAPDPGGPCLDPYCVGTPTPCGFTPQQHMERHGVEAIIEADRVAGLIPGEPVDGTVEAAPGRVTLPDVPDGDYDPDELYTLIMTGAGQQAPPLTTAEVNDLIVRMTGMQPNRVTGHALAQLRAGLKAGVVSWR